MQYPVQNSGPEDFHQFLICRSHIGNFNLPSFLFPSNYSRDAQDSRPPTTVDESWPTIVGYTCNIADRRQPTIYATWPTIEIPETPKHELFKLFPAYPAFSAL